MSSYCWFSPVPLLVVSVDALPFILTCVFVTEVACTFITACFPHDVLTYGRPTCVYLLHIVIVVSDVQRPTMLQLLRLYESNNLHDF
jgi:hypothetical protein